MEKTGDLQSQRKIRIEKVAKLRKLGFDPYPASVNKDMLNEHIIKNYDKYEGEAVYLAGRIMSWREHGKLIFSNIQDESGQIQLYIKKDEIEKFSTKENNLGWENLELVDLGDFVECYGIVTKTKRGEVSLLVKRMRIITKSVRPLPEKWHGIENQEERYRKRYLDILTNPDVRKMFELKAKFWEVNRQFFRSKGFFEVETPTLEVTTGGAEANPFRTHHKDYDMDVYLRISVGELWQKRLMAAGYEKTFEIGRIYRNEGSSPNHLQEFTNGEFYWAYANYKDGMELVKELYRTIADELFGTMKFRTGEYEWDLSGEWREVDYAQEIKERTGIDIFDTEEKEIEKKLSELGVEYEGQSLERLMDTLWKYCRKQIAGPAFLVNHPKLVSPLAKAVKDNTSKVQRFQPLIAGVEAGNGYSELNDPIDQRERFKVQQELIARGDTEAMMPDWEFVEMLEHGMPPTCGYGWGERLFALMVDRPVREITLFPLMKPDKAASDTLKLNPSSPQGVKKGVRTLGIKDQSDLK